MAPRSFIQSIFPPNTWGRFSRIIPPAPLSATAYEFTLALCRVCNQRDSNALDQLNTRLELANQTNELPTREAAELESIIDLANANQWHHAEAPQQARFAELSP